MSRRAGRQTARQADGLARTGARGLPGRLAVPSSFHTGITDSGRKTDDGGSGNVKKFKKREKGKEVVTETVEPRVVRDRPKTGWDVRDRPKAGCYICDSIEHRMRDCPKRNKLNALVAEHTDNEREMGSMRGSSMQIGALRVQSHACGNSCKTGLLIVKGLIAGAEIEVVANTGATHSLISSRIVQQMGLDIKTFQYIPWLDGIYIARCKYPRLVKGMYGKGKPRAKKKLYDETHSSNIVGFCCIEKMEDEMKKQWDKAQRELVTEQEETASGRLPKRRMNTVERWADDTSDVEQESQATCVENSTRVSKGDGTDGLQGRLAEQAWTTAVTVGRQMGETRQKLDQGWLKMLATCTDAHRPAGHGD
ncbi:hypothetical protein Salat_2748300 [Sesamum alatum]|uniref:CCHC-type domain-containing protein n=1 Tax=Sesamum alatum TaxID=300844 RepID=A0AAE2C8X2_9LAMI|nr:hypothetical protein Salat_2748300 [Sesamum alatum]